MRYSLFKTQNCLFFVQNFKFNITQDKEKKRILAIEKL